MLAAITLSPHTVLHFMLVLQLSCITLLEICYVMWTTLKIRYFFMKHYRALSVDPCPLHVPLTLSSLLKNTARLPFAVKISETRLRNCINKPIRCTFCMYLFYNMFATLHVSKDYFVHHQEFINLLYLQLCKTMQTCLTARSCCWNWFHEIVVRNM